MGEENHARHGGNPEQSPSLAEVTLQRTCEDSSSELKRPEGGQRKKTGNFEVVLRKRAVFDIRGSEKGSPDDELLVRKDEGDEASLSKFSTLSGGIDLFTDDS